MEVLHSRSRYVTEEHVSHGFLFGIRLALVGTLLTASASAQVVYAVPGGGYALTVAKRWWLDSNAEKNHLRLMAPSKSGGYLSIRAHFTLTPFEAFVQQVLDRDLATIEGSSLSREIKKSESESEDESEANLLVKAVVSYKLKRKDFVREYVFMPGDHRVVVALYECQVARLNSTRRDVDAMIASLEPVEVVPQVRFEGQEIALAVLPEGFEFKTEIEPALQKETFAGGRQLVFAPVGDDPTAVRCLLLMVFREGVPRTFKELVAKTDSEFAHYSNVRVRSQQRLNIDGRPVHQIDLISELDGHGTILSRVGSFLGSDAVYIAMAICAPTDEKLFSNAFEEFIAAVRGG